MAEACIWTHDVLPLNFFNVFYESNLTPSTNYQMNLKLGKLETSRKHVNSTFRFVLFAFFVM